MRLFDICVKCKKAIAISPDGLCNNCDKDALLKRKQLTIKKVKK